MHWWPTSSCLQRKEETTSGCWSSWKKLSTLMTRTSIICHLPFNAMNTTLMGLTCQMLSHKTSNCSIWRNYCCRRKKKLLEQQKLKRKQLQEQETINIVAIVKDCPKDSACHQIKFLPLSLSSAAFRACPQRYHQLLVGKTIDGPKLLAMATSKDFNTSSSKLFEDRHLII